MMLHMELFLQQSNTLLSAKTSLLSARLLLSAGCKELPTLYRTGSVHLKSDASMIEAMS